MLASAYFDSTLPVESLQRRAWAQELIDRAARPLPAYGSRAWNVLPLNDPRRLAACVVAAECWATDGEELPERLAREIENRRAADERRQAEEDAQRQADWEAFGKRLAARSRLVDHAERVRELQEARRPRVGDFQGRARREAGEVS